MLTKRQKQILDFVKSFSKKNGYSPSLEEIKKHFHLKSVATIHEHLQKLEEKGYLQKIENRARAISAKEEKIPLLGIIPAGGPIEVFPNKNLIEVPKNMLTKNSNYYALKVLGTSMIEEGISDGDIVIIREQSIIENGEKAVAYLPDKNAVTLKKIYQEKNRIKLVPANKYMKPFYEKNVEIQGKVVGVLRKEN